MSELVGPSQMSNLNVIKLKKKPLGSHECINIVPRGNFTEKAKTLIYKDATNCRMCQIPTECGECAHIVSAGHKGPRNKQSLIKKGIITDDYDVGSQNNGLYLCANCHTKIDKYPNIYTFKYLIDLKHDKPHQMEQEQKYVQCPDEEIIISIADCTSIDQKGIKHENRVKYVHICEYCGNSFTCRSSLFTSVTSV